jgi:hypothetical protein
MAFYVACLVMSGLFSCSRSRHYGNIRIQHDKGRIHPTQKIRRMKAKKLLAAAHRLRSRSAYRVGHTLFSHDCAGYVQATLTAAGFDLQAHLPQARPKEGAVGYLFRMAHKHGMLHKRSLPRSGDLVFFDNTWDRNRNGRLDDPLTHVGIVVSTDPDGTITYIHKVRRGVKLYKLNRRRPLHRDPKTQKVLNSYLRRCGYAGNKRRLSGQLFRSYATVYR